jgi:FKBP-type peptidyl-prolyl cis-trans isomerase SlyD
MIIAKHKVVGIQYKLTNEKGDVLDQSSTGSPLYFIQGIGNLIPGLEEALEGKQAGDTLQVVVEPDKAYGHSQPELINEVDKEKFGDQEIVVGMQFTATAGESQYNVMVTAVSENTVTVDANHPLAGQTLHFDVVVENVRDAQEDELSHGHVHGPGGHHH